MTPGNSLSDAASGFADRLTSLFEQVLPYEVPAFVCIEGRGAETIKIGPDPGTDASGPFARIKLVDGDEEYLSLKVEHVVDMDDERQHLRVISSTVGLWLQATDRVRPVFRVEYDRTKTSAPVGRHDR
ncbi:MAG: hypothetical protein ACK5RL_06160 [Acidimicrobiales bacterium]